MNMVSFRPRDMGQKFPFQLADMKMAKINGGFDQNYLLHPGMIVQGMGFFFIFKKWWRDSFPGNYVSTYITYPTNWCDPTY